MRSLMLEYYRVKGKIKKAVQFYKMYLKWCNEFDKEIFKRYETNNN